MYVFILCVLINKYELVSKRFVRHLHLGVNSGFPDDVKLVDGVWLIRRFDVHMMLGGVDLMPWLDITVLLLLLCVYIC